MSDNGNAMFVISGIFLFGSFVGFFLGWQFQNGRSESSAFEERVALHGCKPQRPHGEDEPPVCVMPDGTAYLRHP